MGLAVLKYIDSERDARARIAKIYHERLGQIVSVTCVAAPDAVRNSYQYFIIRIQRDLARKGRDELHAELKQFNIFTRKYFYPLGSTYSCYSDLPSAAPERLPNAHRVASVVLALPIYGALGEDGAHRVCDAISFLMRPR
jgi:dTDP-4-amino-4,6-dideoxygalactose transaminase